MAEGIHDRVWRSLLQGVGRRVFRRRRGERSIRTSYLEHYGKAPNCEQPQTFSEKVVQRMLAIERNADRTFTPLVDKYLVRSYVRDRVGAKHLTRLLWQGRDPADIPFDSLPVPYVIKTNHGSGGHVFVRGDVDRAQVVARMRAALRENYYWRSREYQYFHVVPRVLVEEVIDDGMASGPLDYRCWCFHGEVQLIQVDDYPHSIEEFYDPQWHRLTLQHRVRPEGPSRVARPDNLAALIGVAQALARGFDFVRVDLYNAAGRVYFGELTFTPRAGIFSFQPASWDTTIGSWW